MNKKARQRQQPPVPVASVIRMQNSEPISHGPLCSSTSVSVWISFRTSSISEAIDSVPIRNP